MYSIYVQTIDTVTQNISYYCKCKEKFRGVLLDYTYISRMYLIPIYFQEISLAYESFSFAIETYTQINKGIGCNINTQHA